MANKVDIITVTRNNTTYLQKYLEALTTNTDGEHWKLTVVSNHSTPANYAEELSLKNKYGFDLHQREKTQSFSANCNLGVSITSEEYICFLNDDTEPQKEWLDEMLKILKASKQNGIVGAKLYFPNNYIQHCGIAFHSNKMPGHIWWNQIKKDDKRASKKLELKSVTGGCMLMRRELFEELGGFDENYLVAGYEDIDLCLKADVAKYKIIYCPTAEVLHHEKVTQNKISPATRAEYHEHNTEYFMSKWYSYIVPDYHKYEHGVR